MKESTGLNCEVYDSIGDIERTVWDSLIPAATGLKYNVLQAVEYSGINDLVCQYLLFKDTLGEAQAKANLYQVTMDLTTMGSHVSRVALHTIKQWHPEFLNLSMIECGLFAMNGEGLVCSNRSLLGTVVDETTNKMQLIADKNHLDLLVVRDVPLDHFTLYYDILSAKGFYPVSGFANAVIELRWENFDDFLKHLSSKDRYKFKTALRIEEKFNIHVEAIRDYQNLAPEMAQLWTNVNASAKEYSREQLDEAFFRASAQLTRDNSEIIAFFHETRLVAFMWNLIGSEDYHMADWGVDYSFPQYREANFYRAASIISLRRALESGKKRMQLGMTNYTPKKLLGAQFQPLVYFVKHRNNSNFSRTVARMITDAIEQPEPLDYYKISNDWPRVSMTQAEYRAQISDYHSDYCENDFFPPREQSYDIDVLKLGGLYAFYPPLQETRNQVQLSGNSDLGLLKQPRVTQAAESAFAQYGLAIQPAAFFSGLSSEENTLADVVAAHLHKDASMITSSGYLAHMSALSVIAHEQVVVFMDEQNSPVLWDAVKLGGAQIVTYPHGDYAQLTHLLEKRPGHPTLIVSEAVFSIFGNRADIGTLCEIKNRQKACLYVDESKSYGIVGPAGAGLCVAEGIQNEVDIIAGSFSHAVGIEGGFLAGTLRVIDYIKHQSTPLLFSNKLSRLSVLTTKAALDSCQKSPFLRVEVLEKSRYLADQLETLGYHVIFHEYPVISLVLGDFMLALSVQGRCLDQGLLVTSLGPPVLPEEVSGIRLSVNASLTWEDLEHIVSVFKAIKADIDTSPVD